MAPRTTADPRPVCSPVSDSASDHPMLTPAPRAVDSPTSKAVREFEATAAAKIGASDDTVPSMRPTNAGCTTRRTKSDSEWKPARRIAAPPTGSSLTSALATAGTVATDLE